MENKNNPIDGYFRQRLAGLEQDPPGAVWESLAQKLGHRKKKGMALLVFKIAAGIAFLISAGTGIYLLTTSSDEVSVVNVAHQVTRPDVVRKLPEASPIPAGTVQVSPMQQHPNPSVALTADREYIALKPITVSIEPKPIKFTLPGIFVPADFDKSPELTEEESLALLMADYAASEPPKDNVKHWILGSEVAPLYSDRSIASDDMDTKVIDNLNRNESGVFAYAGGISIAYATGRRLSVQSGVYYSRYGQEKEQVRSYGNKNAAATIEGNRSSSYIAVTNSTGIIHSKEASNAGYDLAIAGEGNITADAESNYAIFNNNALVNSIPEETNLTLSQVFDYLELPVMLRYKVIDRKLDFSFHGGVITNFLVGNAVSLTEDGETTRIGETTNINQVNYQGSLGMGLEYPVASNFALTLEPRFRYYINPLDKSSRINVHPYSFGIFAGISYVF